MSQERSSRTRPNGREPAREGPSLAARTWLGGRAGRRATCARAAAWCARSLPGAPTRDGRERRAARAALRGGHRFLAELDAAAALSKGARREALLGELGQWLARAVDRVEGRPARGARRERADDQLVAALGPRGFAPRDLQAAHAAAVEESTLAVPASSAELERAALRSSGRACSAWVRAAGVDHPRAFARADALDTARRLALWADDLLGEAAAGRLRLALSELDASPLEVTALLSPAVRRDPALAVLLSARVGRIRGLLANARDAREDLPRPERWILAAHARGTEAACRRLELRGFKPRSAPRPGARGGAGSP